MSRPLKKYTYTGPTSGVTLGSGKEILLFNGKDYDENDLPPDDPYVRVLAKQKYLAEKNEPAPAPEASLSKKKKGKTKPKPAAPEDSQAQTESSEQTQEASE